MARLQTHRPDAKGEFPANGSPNVATPPSDRQNFRSSGTKWHSAGPAAFDFRSDVVTTPTRSMLASVTNTTLLDDVRG